MRGLLRFLAVAAIVILISSATLAAPTVQFMSFDPATYRYIYQVSLPVGGGDSLSEFVVDAFALSTTGYSMADVTNISGTSGTWSRGRTYWYEQPNNTRWVAYRWYNGSAGAGWIGQFSMTVTGSHPANGTIVLVDTGAHQTSYTLSVPSTKPTPEPGSFLALGGMLLGIAPVLIRLMKR